MMDTVFCYHCRRYHPTAEVRRVHSKGVSRWRCLKSIASSQGSRAQRDAFGKATHEMNQKQCLQLAEQKLPHCVREVLRSQVSNLGSPA